MSLPNPEPREIVVQLRWLGLRLWQRQDFFGFTEDSLALAEFVGKQPECQHICDLGSGSGGLLFLVWAKNQRAICQGLEIIPENVALAERSKQLNAALPGLLANCRFQQGDWRTPWLYFAPQSFDLLVSNPRQPTPPARRRSHRMFRLAGRTFIQRQLAAAPGRPTGAGFAGQPPNGTAPAAGGQQLPDNT